MKQKRFILYSLLTALLLLVTLPYLWKIFSILFLNKNMSILGQLSLFKWAACGAVAYLVFKRFATKNITFFETFSHELTHIVVALMFFRKVHSFNANEGDGVVSTSGKNSIGLIPLALAPYCLPIFTYMLLFVRCLIGAEGLWVFDIFVGFSLAFHLGCFVHQTGNYQTDINQFPSYFSYLYIATMLIINLCIITVAFFPHYNVFTSFWRYVTFIYSNTLSYFL